MNIFENILNFILNFVIAPLWVISSMIWKFFTDVMKHLYGKILVPLVAIGIAAYIIQHFLK